MGDKDFAIALRSIVDCYNTAGMIKRTLQAFNQLRDIERLEALERALNEYEEDKMINYKKYRRLTRILLIISIIGLISIALNIIHWL